VEFVLRAARPVTSGPIVARVYSRGRRCSEESCGTILSIYNPSSYCSLHAREIRRPNTRRQREREMLTRTCALDICGRTFETGNIKRRYCSDRCRMNAFAQRKREAADLPERQAAS